MALNYIHFIATFILGLAGYGSTDEYCLISKRKSYYFSGYSYSDSGITYRLEYSQKQCYDSCCQYSDGYKYCCYKSSVPPLSINSMITAGEIIGISMGCLIAAGIFLFIIVCCCISASRNRSMPGRVLQNRQNIAVITTSPTVQTTPYHHHAGTSAAYLSHSTGVNNTAYYSAPPSYDTVMHGNHGGNHGDNHGFGGGGFSAGAFDTGGGGFTSGGCDSGGGGGGCDSGGGGGCDSGGGGGGCD